MAAVAARMARLSADRRPRRRRSSGELLREAGGLLEERGTQKALERMLDIVTGGRATVRDSGASAAFWVLSSRRTRLTARLGCDTRVVAHRPKDFVLGRNDLRLGEAPLGRSCTDVDACSAPIAASSPSASSWKRSERQR